MNRVLAFSGSNSSKSINQKLVNYTSSLIKDVEVKTIDIGQWDLPIYSIDMDPDQTPGEIQELIKLIEEYDGFIISSPEHNGGTPAFFKNILDWLSRRSKKVFGNKPVFLMSTSPGPKGGINNRKQLEHMLPYIGASVIASYSLPSFQNNMMEGELSESLQNELKVQLDQFLASLL